MTLASEVCENIDRRFGALIAGSGTVELLFNKCRWAEGPVWFADTNQLVWSDIPNSRMLR